jgi:DNA-binding MarR family transcriptional regulator
MSISASGTRGGRRGAQQRDELVGRIVELAPGMRRAFDVHPRPEERADWLDLTGHQLDALAALAGASLTMRELCVHLNITESAGTALSDRLVARDMVSREADPSDRRVVRLALSDTARQMVDDYRRSKRERIARTLAVLDDDDLASLARIYETVVSAADTERPPRVRPVSARPRGDM